MVLTLGDILNPLFIAIVFAYLLEWVVSTIHKKGCPRGLAVFSVFTGFIALSLTTIFIFIPLIWNQVRSLFNDVPDMLVQGQEKLLQLPKEYPNFIIGISGTSFGPILPVDRCFMTLTTQTEFDAEQSKNEPAQP